MAIHIRQVAQNIFYVKTFDKKTETFLGTVASPSLLKWMRMIMQWFTFLPDPSRMPPMVISPSAFRTPNFKNRHPPFKWSEDSPSHMAGAVFF
jgi:hypothetical protein